MAAGLVYHNLTTAAGVTFTVAKWVPDTTVPNANALPIHVLLKSDGTPMDFGAGTGGAGTQRFIVDSSQVFPPGQNTMANSQPIVQASDQASLITCSTDITRQANATAYTVNSAWSDSSTAPTAGGFTLTNAGGISGGSGIITDLSIVSSNDPATLLQGELWIFDSATTAINDLAAFSVSSTDIKKLVGVVPFTLASAGTASGGATKGSAVNIQNLNLGFTCVGTASLRYLVNVKNAYTPASAEVLTVRAKSLRAN